MFYNDDEMDDDEIERRARKIEKELNERSKKDFIEGCYEAYDLLATRGDEALQGAEITSIQKAINRMTTLFIMREEYERCQFLKRFVSEKMPGFEITPDPEIEKQLNP